MSAVATTERPAPRRAAPRPEDDDAFWRAFASPWRRAILDELAAGPRTTGELADRLPDLSRFAVMQHLGVLTEAGIVVVERRGRHRYNHVNAAALRGFYERWVNRYADAAAGELTALRSHLEEEHMSTATETVKVLRLESELRFAAPPERVFRALTDPDEVLKWFPYTYGEDRVKRIVLEPRVGGVQYEDWGDGAGHFYGTVLEWDPPRRITVRSRLHPGTIMDTTNSVEPTESGAVLRSSRVIVGPITDEQERGIRFHGDLARFAEAIRAVVEGEPSAPAQGGRAGGPEVA
ncbi:MAG TPA: helix-turn-helix domain-containing protein [Trueperaceae bacterium]|jgi:DNA-binding transcriptional ArsR family regulator